MDSLYYFYGTGSGGYTPNELKILGDMAPDVYNNDIKHNGYTPSSPPNYRYDLIGNTKRDVVSGQDTIEWNLYNKVIATRSVNDSNWMSFEYDGAGNRIAKRTSQLTSAGMGERNDYYVHDAQGNILAIYHETAAYNVPHTIAHSRSFDLAEHDIYGSSRLGVKTYRPGQVGISFNYVAHTADTVRLWQRRPWYSAEYQDVITDTAHFPYANALLTKYLTQHITGLKQYELTDHLGDVLATISDARQVDSPKYRGSIRWYEPVVQSAYDYYPFGMLMPGRYRTDSGTHCSEFSQTSMVG